MLEVNKMKKTEEIKRTWKAKGKGGGEKKIDSYRYFYDKGCVSCGWSFSDAIGREKIKSLDDYKEFWREEVKKSGLNNKWGNQGVHQLLDNVHKRDFIWTRIDGEYYVAEVKGTPEELFSFDASKDATENDCSAQLKVDWIKVGKEDEVPGSVSVYTQNRSALSRVDNNDEVIDVKGNQYTVTSAFSAICTNSIKKEDIKTPDNRSYLFNLIGYAEAEDLIALWLYDKYGYVTVPSTNKIGTETYEFVLLDGSKNKDGSYTKSRKIYIQVKNGNNILEASKYTSLLDSTSEEVWLVSTRGHVEGKGKPAQIKRFVKKDDDSIVEENHDINEVLDFAFDPKKRNIIPNTIKQWIDLFF